jgi:hypothetical protein
MPLAYPEGKITLLNGFSFNPNLSTQLPAGTTSADILAAMQAAWGTQQYADQKSARWPYYSYVNYPAAGSNAFNFFGQNYSQATNGLGDTNIEGQNNLGNYSMFVQSIGLDFRVLLPAVSAAPQVYTTDAVNIANDLLSGFAQAGYWTFTVGTNLWDMCPRPFLYSPPGNGAIRMETTNAFAFTQSGDSPFAVTAAATKLQYADLERRAFRRRVLKNPLFLAPQQTFQAKLSYDSGAIPIIATSIITGTATLSVGAILDGTRFAPIG